jgi:hypothetical protein
MSIPTSACLWGHAQKTFFYPLTVSQFFFFFSEMSLLLATYGWVLFFLIQFAILYLLIGGIEAIYIQW